MYKLLLRISAVILALIMLVSLCACGQKLTPEESVRKNLISEFRWDYGLNMERCEFTEVKTTVVTAEMLKRDRWLAADEVHENDVIFQVTYDIKARFNPEWLPTGNGEIDGHWVRNAYCCGYLKYISEGKYELLSIGTGF